MQTSVALTPILHVTSGKYFKQSGKRLSAAHVIIDKYILIYVNRRGEIEEITAKRALKLFNAGYNFRVCAIDQLPEHLDGKKAAHSANLSAQLEAAQPQDNPNDWYSGPAEPTIPSVLVGNGQSLLETSLQQENASPWLDGLGANATNAEVAAAMPKADYSVWSNGVLVAEVEHHNIADSWGSDTLSLTIPILAPAATATDDAGCFDECHHNSTESPIGVLQVEDFGQYHNLVDLEPATSGNAHDFAAGLNSKFPTHVFTVQEGFKYDRIVHNGGSVHAFVERATGAVLKPAGWKTPAKGVRYTTVEAAIAAADLYGGYLYAQKVKETS